MSSIEASKASVAPRVSGTPRATRRLGFAAVGITLAACDPSAGSSKFPNGTPNTEPTNDAPPVDGTPGRFSSTADGTIATTPDDFRSCATKTATAESKPIYLVFMFDKSGSMSENDSPKWSSATAASRAFFESAESKGVYASLAFFPDQPASYSCVASGYSTPSVAMTSLPSMSFGSSLDEQTPSGDTPTLAALGGAISYAESVSANEGKDGTVAIVLVTDGLPDSICDGNSVSAVRELAASVKDTLPTYVIGVGDQLTSLKDIALAGGTNDAFIVSASDPVQIRQDFLAAVNAIKKSAIACDYEIPPPPAGEALDRDKVNVLYTSDESSEAIPYTPACSEGPGWRYDDVNAPKRILLCDASCASARARPGKTEVLFGCATRSRVVQ